MTVNAAIAKLFGKSMIVHLLIHLERRHVRS